MFGVDESKQNKTSMYQALDEVSRLFDNLKKKIFNLKETTLFPVGCLMYKFICFSLFFV